MSAEKVQDTSARSVTLRDDVRTGASTLALTSLLRRDALFGLAGLAIAPALAGCGGGGGAAASPPSPPGPVAAPPVPLASESFAAQINHRAEAFSFQSQGSARDVEVSFTYNYTGRIFLRVTGGRAILFDFAPSSFYIGLVSGLTESTYYAPVEKRMHDQGGGLIAGATVVFGVSGFDIYVKQNGVEILRFKCWHHTASGKVACKEPHGTTRSAGIVTFNADATLYSTPQQAIYDPRDFGLRSISTTGGISGSSTTLSVASAAGFLVGDHVIVEIGAESGAGARGTKGVGGTWPALSYANSTARAADTGQASGTYAWQVDTGNVYRWQSSAWTQQTDYYIAKAIPRSLQARITAISGNNLTLSVAATVTATNANVYLDNTPFINILTHSIWYKFGSPVGDLRTFVPSGMRIVLPAGTYHIGGGILIPSTGASSAANIPSIEGAGATTILKSPKGVPCAGLEVDEAQGKTVISNLKIVGNARDEGFGLNWETLAIPYGSGSGGFEWDYESLGGGPTTETSAPQGRGTYPCGAYMVGCTNCTIDSVTAVDVFQYAAGGSYCTSCTISDCTVTMTDGLRMYLQWHFGMSDCTGGTIDNCTVTSPRLLAGFETFRSNGVTISNCTGNNATYSSNSSGSFNFTNCTSAVTVTDNDQAISGFSRFNPMFNINSNIQPPDASMTLGGTLTNCVMTQASYIDTSNNTLFGIVVNANNPNITIMGGSYTAPDYHAGSDAQLGGAVGINSTGSNTDVMSFTVTGKAKHETVGGTTYRNIHLTGGGGSSATNCAAREIYVGP